MRAKHEVGCASAFRELYEHLLLLPHQPVHNQRLLPPFTFPFLHVFVLYPHTLSEAARNRLRSLSA